MMNCQNLQWSEKVPKFIALGSVQTLTREARLHGLRRPKVWLCPHRGWSVPGKSFITDYRVRRSLSEELKNLHFFPAMPSLNLTEQFPRSDLLLLKAFIVHLE